MRSGPPTRVRLFLFHHAGGSRLLYRGWDRRFPLGWTVHAPDAPGRGRLHRSPVATDVDELVDVWWREVSRHVDQPIALFGHSMGALVANQLTNRLVAEGGPIPVWVGLSGWGADARSNPAVELGGEELRNRLTQLGGTPAELLADDGAWQLVVRLLRRDLAMMDSWRPPAGDPLGTGPLPTGPAVPISLFGGADDDLAGPDQLTELAGRSRGRHVVGVHVHPGGHFFLQHCAAEVTRQITNDVRTVLHERPDLWAISAANSTRGA